MVIKPFNSLMPYTIPRLNNKRKSNSSKAPYKTNRSYITRFYYLDGVGIDTAYSIYNITGSSISDLYNPVFLDRAPAKPLGGERKEEKGGKTIDRGDMMVGAQGV